MRPAWLLLALGWTGGWALACATPTSPPAQTSGGNGDRARAPTAANPEGRAPDGAGARSLDDALARVERTLAHDADRRSASALACARGAACTAPDALVIDDDVRAVLRGARDAPRARAVVRGIAHALVSHALAKRAPRAVFFEGDAPFLVDDLPVLIVEAGVRAARLLEAARGAVPGARPDEQAAWTALVARAADVGVPTSALVAASAGLSERALSALVDRVLDDTARALSPPTGLLDAPRALVAGTFAIDPARALSGPLFQDGETSPAATPSALARCTVDGERRVAVVHGATDTPLGRVSARRARACALLPNVAPAAWPSDPLIAEVLAELAHERAPVDEAERGAHARARTLTLRARAIAVRVVLDGTLDDARARDAVSSSWGDARGAPIPGAALLLPPIDPARAALALLAHVAARALDVELTVALGPAWPDGAADVVHPALATALAAILDDDWATGGVDRHATQAARHSFAARASSSSSRSSSTSASMRIQLPITIAQKPSD